MAPSDEDVDGGWPPPPLIPILVLDRVSTDVGAIKLLRSLIAKIGISFAAVHGLLLAIHLVDRLRYLFNLSARELDTCASSIYYILFLADPVFLVLVGVWYYLVYRNASGISVRDDSADALKRAILVTMPYVRLFIGYAMTRRLWLDSAVNRVSPRDLRDTVYLIASLWLCNFLGEVLVWTVYEIRGSHFYAMTEILKELVLGAADVLFVMFVNKVTAVQLIAASSDMPPANASSIASS